MNDYAVAGPAILQKIRNLEKRIIHCLNIFNNQNIRKIILLRVKVINHYI